MELSHRLERARRLRRNITDVERFVWGQLRNRRLAGFKFRRQVPIGPFIVDFVCEEKRLVLELDGGQHNDAAAKDYDDARTAWLKAENYQVMRYWNHEVKPDWDLIAEHLAETLQKRIAD